MTGNRMGNRIADAALVYLDTPWVHQGRIRAGVDCVGLLVCAARDAGAEIDDVTDYPAQMAGPWLVESLTAHCDRLPKAGPYERGDVLAFLFGAQPWHVGLVTQTDPVRMVHSYRTLTKVVEQPLDGWWIRHIHSAWRLK